MNGERKEPELTIHRLDKALRPDLLAEPFESSFDLVDRLQVMLAGGHCDVNDPSVPRVYALLVRSGMANRACHLAMARHLAHAGDHARALRLLEALTVLDPFDREAWLLTASIARRLGEVELALRAEVEAASIGGLGPVPFLAPECARA